MSQLSYFTLNGISRRTFKSTISKIANTTQVHFDKPISKERVIEILSKIYREEIGSPFNSPFYWRKCKKIIKRFAELYVRYCPICNNALVAEFSKWGYDYEKEKEDLGIGMKYSLYLEVVRKYQAIINNILLDEFKKYL